MTSTKIASKYLLLMVIPALLLFACSKSENLPPAPLDSTSGLQSLATAYEAVSNNLAMAPIKLQPQARKQFVINVFNRANFSYAKTLQAFLPLKNTKISKNIKDLAELLSLPHKNISSKSRIELYTEQELKAIDQVDKIVN